MQGQRKVRALSPLDVTAVIQGMPWFSDDAAAGEMLAKRACQAHDSPVSGWELHTSLEAIDMMPTPLLADAEEQDDSPEHLTADGHSAGEHWVCICTCMCPAALHIVMVNMHGVLRWPLQLASEKAVGDWALMFLYFFSFSFHLVSSLESGVCIWQCEVCSACICAAARPTMST